MAKTACVSDPFARFRKGCRGLQDKVRGQKPGAALGEDGFDDGAVGLGLLGGD